MRTIAGISELESLVGEELGVSSWLRVDQGCIDRFAEATGDRQWLHVDPERAAAGPFGTTIAHGYLTLSLLPDLVADVFVVGDVRARINYGLDRVRFPRPVRSGESIRDRVTLVAAERTKEGLRTVVRNVVEVSGADRPACIADVVTIYLGEES